MKIEKERPFWLNFVLKKKFPHLNFDVLIVVWGDIIYSKYDIPDHILVHEKVHIEQQRNKWRGLWWWIGYLFDKDFRYEQEIQAYQAQYRYAKKILPREKIHAYTLSLATNLKEMYSIGKTLTQCYEEIKH